MTIKPERMTKLLAARLAMAQRVIDQVCQLRVLVDINNAHFSRLREEQIGALQLRLDKALLAWSQTRLVIEPGGAALLVRRTVRRSRTGRSGEGER